MDSIRNSCRRLAHNRIFEFAITGIILLNSVLIGVETYTGNATIQLIQQIILYIFTFEIIIRFIAAKNIRSFFCDGWNIFDLTLVLIGYIPETLVANGSTIMALRVLRVFRVLRLLRSAKELKLIVTVLVKSMSAMFYNLILFLIFVYLYAIVGVSLFRLPNPQQLTEEAKTNYEAYLAEAPHAPGNSPDPFGDLGEAVFTLFRELTGEDWTDLRYNHLTAAKHNVIHVSSSAITIYHVSWFCLAAFLLLNMVTGAVLNNYQLALEEREEKKRQQMHPTSES
ncbi:MAG: ion transporter [Prevotellaceae bacterium]|nr:ion transporter [Prevotellaceae bacterium]